MDISSFASLPKISKIRCILFLMAAAGIVVMGVNCTSAYHGYQMEKLFSDINTNVVVDGVDFSWLFMAGLDAVNYTVSVITMIGYCIFMIVFSVIIALIFRLTGLRKVWQAGDTEFGISAAGYCVMTLLGIIISLIITKGGLVLAIMMFMLPQFAIIWLVYLLELRKRSTKYDNGHFIEDTKQDLTQL